MCTCASSRLQKEGRFPRRSNFFLMVVRPAVPRHCLRKTESFSFVYNTHFRLFHNQIGSRLPLTLKKRVQGSTRACRNCICSIESTREGQSYS